MSEVETVTIPVNAEPGATSVSTYGSPDVGGKTAEELQLRRGEKILPMPGLPTQTLDVGKRQISEAARARVAAIMEKRQQQDAARKEPDPEKEKPAPAPAEVKVAAIASPKGKIDPNAPAQVEREDDDPDAPPGAAPEVTPQAAAPAAAAPAPAASDEAAELRATVERQQKIIDRQRQDREQRGKSRDDETRQFAERFAAAEDGYANDPVAGVRKYVAAMIGAKDEKAAEVDAELDDLLADLTSHRLSVPLDPAHHANRKATLTDRRVKIAEQRLKARERDEQASRTKEAESSRAQSFQRDVIAPAIDKAKFPNLANATHLDKEGRSPERVVYDAIVAGIQGGLIDPTEKTEAAVARVLAAQESFFRTRAESLRAVLQPGTAAPDKAPSAQRTDGSPAAVTNDKARQGHGSRTITTADASVAPATSQTRPAESGPRQYVNDDHRRAAALAKNFPDTPAGKAAKARLAKYEAKLSRS